MRKKKEPVTCVTGPTSTYEKHVLCEDTTKIRKKIKRTSFFLKK